jgi:hypothetical protein
MFKVGDHVKEDGSDKIKKITKIEPCSCVEQRQGLECPGYIALDGSVFVECYGSGFDFRLTLVEDKWTKHKERMLNG